MPGQPAARVTDAHTCPLPGIPPHGGGPILLPGAPTVQSSNHPNARILDLAACVGPPDPIAQGAATVLINGLPATRKLDTTSHGGKVTLGDATVEIGDPAVTLVVKVKKGDRTFVPALQEALAKLLPTPSGVNWLKQMALSGKKVTFKRTRADNGFTTPASAAAQATHVPTDSTIEWNPSKHTLDPGIPGPGGSPGAAVILAHEMVHALHNAQGNERDGPEDHFPGQSGTSARNEERSTVGTSGPIMTPGGPASAASTPDYSTDVPTENSFRDDLGIPRRRGYYPSTWPGGSPW